MRTITLTKILFIVSILSIISIFSTSVLGTVYINEFAANEGSSNFIELYSDSNQSVSLIGWQIEINGARSAPLLFGTLSPTDRYTTYNQLTLGIVFPQGADITLYTNTGNISDRMNASNFASGQSYGRFPDGNANRELMPLTADAQNQRFSNSTGNTTTNSTNSTSMLEITKVRINGDRLSVDTTTDTIDEIVPGESIDILVTIENKFLRSSDEGIDNIDVEVTIQDIDDGDDLDFDADDEFDLDASDEDEVSLDFVVPYEVEHNKKYKFTIEAVGTDSNGTIHRDIVSGYLKVEKEKHSVKITQLLVNPNIVSCQRSINIDVEIKNLGEERERDARLVVQNRDLGINSEYKFNLDEDPFDDDFEFNKNILLSIPEDVREGEYDIEIRTFYDVNSPSDSRMQSIEVMDCVESPVDGGNDDPTDSKGDVSVSLFPSTTEEKVSFVWGPLEISLLAGILVLLIGLIVFVSMSSAKSSKN